MGSNLNRLWIWIAVAVVVAGMITLVYFFDPARYSFYLPCPFYALTGLYCPGCGSGRAVHQILHGNFVKALTLNPLLILTLPLIAYLFAGELLQAIPAFRGRPRPLPGWFVWTILVVILTYWVVRNIPVYPFNLLAPK